MVYFMKILLVNSSRTYSKKSKGVRLALPLGLMYMASVLEKESLTVSIFDCHISTGTRIKETSDGIHHGVGDDFFTETIEKEKPDVVEIVCPFTAQFNNFFHLSADSKIISG
jgi:hypothetical protein